MGGQSLYGGHIWDFNSSKWLKWISVFGLTVADHRSHPATQTLWVPGRRKCEEFSVALIPRLSTFSELTELKPLRILDSRNTVREPLGTSQKWKSELLAMSV